MSSMRRRLLVVLGVLFLLATVAQAQVVLPVRTLGELQRWRIDPIGESYAGGWPEYHIQYKLESAYWKAAPDAGPFETVILIPYTNELLWIEVRTAQQRAGVNGFVAQRAYNSASRYPDQLLFQVFLYGPLPVIAEEHLHFTYRDSAGSFQHLKPSNYEPIYETNSDTPTGAKVEVVTDLPEAPETLEWLVLHVWSETSPGGVEGSWTFRSVAPEQEVHFADPALEMLVRKEVELPHGPLEYGDVRWIRELSGSSYDILSLEGIEQLGALERLDLSYNSIEDITPLGNLPHLHTLDLAYNRVESLAPLSPLGELQELKVQGNHLTSLTGLERLTNLRSLNVSDNPIENLEPLRGLSNLEHLSARGVGIDDVSPLVGLTALRSLDLSNNRIESVDPLRNLVELRTLRLDANRISDLTALVDLRRLENLSAVQNDIRYIEPLADLPGLITADLSLNDIEFLGGWLELEGAPKVITMGNPLIDTGLAQSTMEAVRGTLVETQQVGPYTLRFYDFLYDLPSAVEIWFGDTMAAARVGFSFRPVGPRGQPAEEVQPFALDNTGSTYFWMREYTGGWHCCELVHLFQLEPELRHVDTIVGEHERPEFADLDGDGRLEVLVKDWNFAYWRTSFSGSPAPQVVLTFDGNRFRIAEEHMMRPAPTSAELAALVDEVRRNPMWEAYAKGRSFLLGPPSELWKVMLDLIYTGHWDLAFAFLDAAWPDDVPSKEAFTLAFLNQLQRSRYWSDIVERIYGGRALPTAPYNECPH